MLIMLTQSSFGIMKSFLLLALGAVLAAEQAAAFAFAPLAGSSLPSSFSASASRSAAAAAALRLRAEKVDAEVVSSPGGGKSATAAQMDELLSSATSVFDKLKDAVRNVNADDIQSDVKSATEGLKSNLQKGEVGQRGEIYALGKVVIGLLILSGDLPVIGAPLEFLAGPGLILAGGAMAVAGALTLGPNLSPWAVPSENNILLTTGPFSITRHPIYTGLILSSLGLGVATDSFVRVALTVALYLLLSKNADFEEEALRKVHPAYSTYADETPKLIPVADGLVEAFKKVTGGSS